MTLALLHLKDPMAFDFLLDPQDWQRRFEIGLPKPVTLVELLGEFRWWYVLRHYLPDDAPSFWVWADSDLQEFQVDRLRAWYVIHRNRLRNEAGLGQGIDSQPLKIKGRGKKSDKDSPVKKAPAQKKPKPTENPDSNASEPKPGKTTTGEAKSGELAPASKN